jgi:iron complex outermembrane recepter protein
MRLFGARCVYSALALTTGLLLAQLGFAQSAPQPTKSDEGSLQEITVTATRREESLQKVPVSIAAFSSKDLEDQGIKSIDELAAVVPGLQFQPNGYSDYVGYTSVAIRGFNTLVGPSTVGIYLDEAPLQGRMSSLGDFGFLFPLTFDMERIEVLRGPQGTLFGASSESGALRFIPYQPSLTQFSSNMHSEFAVTEGGAPSYEFGSAVGGPIVNDQLGFRASVWERYEGGYIDRVNPIDGDIISTDSNSSRKIAARLAFAVKAADVLITPAVNYQVTSINGNPTFYDYFSNPSEGQFENGRLIPEEYEERAVIPSLKVAVPLSFADLSINLSGVKRSVYNAQDLSPLNCVVVLGGCGSPIGPGYPSTLADASPSIDTQDLNTMSGEIRLASTAALDERFSWVTGIFVDHRKQQDTQSVSINPMFDVGPNPIFDIDQIVWDNQYAVFAQADVHITQQFTVTLGAREELARYSQVNFNQGVFLAGIPAVSKAPTLSEHPFLPKLALSYQVDPDNMVYGSVSKGLRVGGSNNGLPAICGALAGPGLPFDADYVWAYEVGAKDKFLDGRVAVNTSVFHERWSNIQSSVLLACGQAYTANLGAAVSDGFDMEVQALITEQLRLDVNVGYADLRYVDNAYSDAGILAQAGDAVQALNYTNPPWDVSTSLSYSVPRANGDQFRARAQYIFHSRNNRPVITDDPASPSYAPADVPDPSTHLTNLRAEYTMGKFELASYLNNVFNSHPLLGAFSDTPTSNLITHGTFRPRTLGVSLNYAF